MKKTFFSLFDKAINLIDQATVVVISLALVGFMWGIVKILFNSDNEIAKKEGRAFMLYGILTLFVMTTFWGLVNLLNGTISIQENDDSYVQDPDQSNEPFPPILYD
jgi:hypothetical protein